MQEISSKIDEVASTWALRAQGGPLTPEQDVELQSWLAADTRHFGAYTRAMGVLSYFDRATAIRLCRVSLARLAVIEAGA